MESLFNPPRNLSLEGSIAENWKNFEQKFELFLEATDLKDKTESKQVAVFLNLIGDDGLALYNTFTFASNENPKKLEDVKRKFEAYCAPKRNVIFERYKFNSISQKEGQTFDMFITELRKAVKTTEYSEPDEMIRDRIVIGILDKVTQERLLRESDLTLEKAINFCRASEVSKNQSHVLQAKVNIDEVKKKGKYNSKQRGYKPEIHKQKTNTIEKSEQKISCSYCGYKHPRRQCPAYNKICAACQGKNHFARMCRAKTKRKVIDEVEKKETDANEEFFVHTVKQLGSVRNGDTTAWTKEILIKNRFVKFKLDTGAEVSVLPLSTLKLIDKNIKLRESNIILTSYGSNDFKIRPVGEISLKCTINNVSKNIEFIVVDINQIPLLGLQACIDLGLIQQINSVKCENFDTIESVINQYPNEFVGLGKFPTQYHITLKENSSPFSQPARRIPYTLQSKVKNKLDELETLGVIRKVNEPTDWINPLVIVEKKNGDLRLCLDPKHLNDSIKREHFLIPTVDEISAKLSNKKLFTVLDMKDGYWQVEIDNESADLCTFATPFGRYQFLRLAFGISSAPEVFQKKNYEIFGDISGVGVYFDDIIITGSTEQEHDYNLKLVLERAKKYNLKFNKSKIQLKSSSVKFMGQIFSETGVKPCQDYVKAINEMPKPANKSDVLRLLGMAKFLSKFVPNMSKVTAPLRDLTKISAKWEWSKKHDESLKSLKHLITNSPVLSYFNPNGQIEIESDASKDGLGACLLQDGHPVAFASRSLTQTEQRYAQIEKETLAILFGVEKFHYFVYGAKNVQITTDHKPLVSIFKKDIQKVTIRLQRMLLRLLNYDLNVAYKPGKYMYISDTLSRAFLTNTSDDIGLELEYAIHSISENVAMSQNRKIQFKKATSNDAQLQLLISYCQNGWPRTKKDTSQYIRHFFKLKENLFVSDGLLFLGNKIVVPTTLQKEMLELLHDGHLGIEKTKMRARQIFYWQGLSTQIESHIKECRICEKITRKNCKESLHSYQVPSRPWQRVATDIFSYANKIYLVIYDSFSNWLELLPLNDKSSKSVISALKSIFSRFGSPDTLVADNIPFGSFQLKSFANQWNFNIVTRSPNYPRSNGLAEKAVGIGKTIVKKSLLERTDIYTSLLQYRNTPLKHMEYSPSQLLNSRICKTKVPVTEHLLFPRICENVNERLQQRQSINAKYYNKTSKDLKPLTPESNVTVFNHINKSWEPGQIISSHETPRSYLVRDHANNVIRRNRVDLRESANKYVPVSNSDDNNFVNSECPATCKPVVRKQPIATTNSTQSIMPQDGLLTTRSGRVIKKPNRLDL